MRLIYTSDLHSYLFPTMYHIPGVSNMGHYRIMASYEKDEDTVVIDGGDNLQGSALSKYVMDRNVFSPFPQAEAMKKAGVDYLVPGNHDFNYGYSLFSSFYKESGGKILAANLIDRSGELEILPHVVRTDSSGLRVGFTGLITDYVNVWEKKENLENFEITDSFSAARKELAWLKENADVSVLIYHGGYECDLETGETLQTTNENIACRICRELDYDLVLTAHQHRKVDLMEIAGTKALQCPSFAFLYGEIFIDRNGITGGLKSPKNLVSPMEREKKDLGEEVEVWLDGKLGEIDRAIPAPSNLESMLKGNHIADFFNFLQLQATGADISCSALNNNLYSFSRNVTVREILASYQYPNSICTVEVGEKEIRQALERCAEFFNLTEEGPFISKTFLEPKAELYNYDYYYGLSYSFDLSRPLGHRVTRLLWKGQEIGEKKLTLAMSNYRVTGAGGYSMFVGKNVKNFELDLQDEAIKYFKDHEGTIISWPYADFTTTGY